MIAVVRTQGKSRRTIGIVVAVVVVAVIAVVAYFLLYNGNSGSGSGGGGGYYVFALSMSQMRWIGRKLRGLRALGLGTLEGEGELQARAPARGPLRPLQVHVSAPGRRRMPARTWGDHELRDLRRVPGSTSPRSCSRSDQFGLAPCRQQEPEHDNGQHPADANRSGADPRTVRFRLRRVGVPEQGADQPSVGSASSSAPRAASAGLTLASTARHSSIWSKGAPRRTFASRCNSSALSATGSEDTCSPDLRPQASRPTFPSGS
jgi:hypothetical protein